MTWGLFQREASLLAFPCKRYNKAWEASRSGDGVWMRRSGFERRKPYRRHGAPVGRDLVRHKCTHGPPHRACQDHHNEAKRKQQPADVFFGGNILNGMGRRIGHGTAHSNQEPPGTACKAKLLPCLRRWTAFLGLSILPPPAAFQRPPPRVLSALRKLRLPRRRAPA